MMRKNISFCKIRNLLIIGLVSLLLLFILNAITYDEENPTPRRKKMISIPSSNEDVEYFKGDIYVHLDLKGAAPKVTYYDYLFSLFFKVGVRGVVMEYEDMFPYKENISAFNSYSKSEIETINNLAEKYNLEIIPMVQVISHLEFLLKLQEFKDLREISEYPRTLCLTNEKSSKIVAYLISQILEMHPKSTRIRIGADDTFHIGKCDKCKVRMNENFLSKHDLFIEHIQTIIDKIGRKHNVSVLMCDDELRTLSSSLEVNFRQITPVVSKFTRTVEDELGPSLWEMYKVFPKIWISTLFRGAEASEPFLSDRAYYLDNHRSWLRVIREYRNMVNFEAVIITGFQRYNHFSILTELLPVALPTLLMSIGILRGANNSPMGLPIEEAKLLECDQPYSLMGTSFGAPNCNFPGGKILENVHLLHQLKQELANLLESSQVKHWMSNFNVDYLFSDPERVQSVTSVLTRLNEELMSIENNLIEAMEEIYDIHTINEWKITYIKPLKNQVDKIQKERERLLAKNTWPRNPRSNETTVF